MSQPVFKRRIPLIVATACGLAAGLLAHPLLLRQVQDRVIDEHYAQLSRVTATAAQMASDTQRNLQARALELNLPSHPPGCDEALQQQLQAIQLQTPGVRTPHCASRATASPAPACPCCRPPGCRQHTTCARTG